MEMMFKGYLPRALGLKKFCATKHAPRLRTKSDLLPLEPLEMGRTRCAIHVLRVSFRGCRCFPSVFPPRTHGCSCESPSRLIRSCHWQTPRMQCS